MNTWEFRKNLPKEIIGILAQNKICSISQLFLQGQPCSIQMELSYITDWWNLWGDNIKLEVMMKLLVQIFTIQNSGKSVVTTSNTKTTSIGSDKMESSSGWNLWTALDIALCSIWFRDHTKIYPSDMLILEFFTETSSMELWVDWLVFEDSSKMMPIFSACLNKLKMKYWEF